MDLDICQHIVMLYYKDIDEARRFYGDTLQFEAKMQNDWVTLYQATPSSLIGTVKEGGEGGYHKVQENNAVMISLATKNVTAWYDQLDGTQGISFIKRLYDASSLPIRAFLITDPGGYTIEFFQWLDDPESGLSGRSQ